MIQDTSAQDIVSHPDTMIVLDAERAGRAVVRLRGEYDRANVLALATQLSGAIAACDGDVVVDLSGVEFMDSSTINVLEKAGAFLGHRSRSLLLRSPSTFGRRLLDVCGLGDLIEGTPGRLPLSA